MSSPKILFFNQKIAFKIIKNRQTFCYANKKKEYPRTKRIKSRKMLTMILKKIQLFTIAFFHPFFPYARLYIQDEAKQKVIISGIDTHPLSIIIIL